MAGKIVQNGKGLAFVKRFRPRVAAAPIEVINCSCIKLLKLPHFTRQYSLKYPALRDEFSLIA